MSELIVATPSTGEGQGEPHAVEGNSPVVTNLRQIINFTTYSILVRNGENPKETFTVPPEERWTGNLWIPWVSSQDAKLAAITFTFLPEAEAKLRFFLFQDRGSEVIKYCVDVFDFKNAQVVPGDSRQSGEKSLSIKLKGRQLDLYMSRALS